MLKKTATILLLMLFLGANTSLGQLLKLPILFEHFHSHSHDVEHGHVDDFLTFLFEHYSNQSESDNTKHGHDKLPFKNVGSFASSLVIIAPTNNSLTYNHAIATKQTIVPFVNQDYSSAYLESIWQPPRTC